jgi:hypothetical protein
MCDNRFSKNSQHLLKGISGQILWRLLSFICFSVCGDKLIIAQLSDLFLCIISTSLDFQYDKVGTVAMFVIVIQ